MKDAEVLSTKGLKVSQQYYSFPEKIRFSKLNLVSQEEEECMHTCMTEYNDSGYKIFIRGFREPFIMTFTSSLGILYSFTLFW